MVALNFMKQFAGDVENGKKRQTIREKTKARHGCRLQLYTGQRTKACRLLGDVECVSVQKVTLMASGLQQHGSTFCAGYQADEFAKRDGFLSYGDMWSFFKSRANEHGEFIGYLIKW